MSILNFIINNVLTNAAITVSLIAMLGLILQKKIRWASSFWYFKNLAWFSSSECRIKCYCRKSDLLW